MTLQRLLDTAYSRGCGISMERALCTPRYTELLKNSAHLDIQNHGEFASIQLLGELLADRAAKNLPLKVKNKLHLWDEGLEGQLQLLEVVMRTMTSKVWRSYRKTGKYQYAPRAKSVLPDGCKSWERGPVQPNCLGLSQMLVGLARTLGANHYMVNVLQSNDERNLLREQGAFKDVIATIDKYESTPTTLRIKKSLADNYEKSLNYLSKLQGSQAHHAIVIQLCDESWMFVDPYLGVMHPQPLRSSAAKHLLNRIHDDNRRLMLLYGQSTMPLRRESSRRLDALLGGFETALKYRESELQKENTWNMALYGILQAICYLYSDAKGQTSPKRFGKEKRRDFYFIESRLMYASYLSAARYASFTNELSNPNLSEEGYGELQQEFKKAFQSVMASETKAEQAYNRFILALAREIVDELVYMASQWRREHRRHILVEYAHPTTMLATATLNHLRTRNGMYTHGRLCVYTRSQWVLLDTLAAEQKGDAVDAESSKEIENFFSDARLMPRKTVLSSISTIIESR